MKTHYLGWFLVVGSAVAVLGGQVDVVVGLERAEEPGGPWVAVPIEAGMLHGGRVNAGRVTNEKGFYRLAGELVPVASPSPSPSPTPAPTRRGEQPPAAVNAWMGLRLAKWN